MQLGDGFKQVDGKFRLKVMQGEKAYLHTCIDIFCTRPYAHTSGQCILLLT